MAVISAVSKGVWRRLILAKGRQKAEAERVSLEIPYTAEVVVKLKFVDEHLFYGLENGFRFA
jgi:hypothetical protein